MPNILKKCVEFIEAHGIVTGVYRQCGIQSNIQKLRFAPNVMSFSYNIEIQSLVVVLAQASGTLKNHLRCCHYLHQIFTVKQIATVVLECFLPYYRCLLIFPMFYYCFFDEYSLVMSLFCFPSIFITICSFLSFITQANDDKKFKR